MLDIVECEMVVMGFIIYKIIGFILVNECYEMIRVFNVGLKDVFLIFLKVGGVGFNFIGVDIVVLIDLWWNLVVEM